MPGVRRGVCGRSDRPGAGRVRYDGPAVRAGAPARLVRRDRAERPRRPAARGGAGLRAAEPGAAARCPHHRLRAPDGSCFRTTPGRSGRLARGRPGHGRAGGPAGPDGRGRAGRAVPVGRGAEPAPDGDRRPGVRTVPGRAPGAAGHRAQRAAGHRGGGRLRDGLGVHEVGGGELRPGRAGHAVAGADRDRRAGRHRTAAVAGGLPRRRADRAAGHRDGGQSGGRGGGRHRTVRRGLPLRDGRRRRGAGERGGGGDRARPAHRRAPGRAWARTVGTGAGHGSGRGPGPDSGFRRGPGSGPVLRWRLRGPAGTSAGRCRCRSRGPCASRSAGAARSSCRSSRSGRSAARRRPPSRP